MFKDVVEYKNKMKAEQKQNIIDIMNDDEEDGLYDSQRSFYGGVGY